MSAVSTANRNSTSSGFRPLLVQLSAILLALVGYLVWFTAADLSETELNTLAPGALWPLVAQHLTLTFVSAGIVLAIALPLGIVLTRPRLRRVSGAVLAVANFGQAAPPVGVIVLFAAWFGLGFHAMVIALVLYAALPVLRNTMVGLRQVDQSLVEAGRGMGMSALAVLFRVELPLAIPVMLAGIRTALVLLAGTAALGSFIAAGGLGLLIETGVNLFLPRVLIAGALLIALLALFIDWVGRVVEVAARPKGL